jgi:type VI secretion system secreted protein VgrG
VTFVVRPTAAGVLEDTAAVAANENDTAPANNRAVVVSTVRTPAPLPSDPAPMVLGVQRFGIHMQLTRLVLHFSAPLDPARARDPHSYRIVGPGGRTIAVDSAVYDATAQTVTLHPHVRLDVHRRYILTAYGTGERALAGVSGARLDGTRAGRPGSDFATVVDRSVLVMPGIIIARPRRPSR